MVLLDHEECVYEQETVNYLAYARDFSGFATGMLFGEATLAYVLCPKATLVILWRALGSFPWLDLQ